MRCKVHVRFGGGEQSLSYYGWRGADIRNILNFEDDWPDAAVIRLEENYRSTPDILECANTVIENNKNRKIKKLWTNIEESQDHVVVKRFQDDRMEARYVASQINYLVENGGYDYDDFVILYRTNQQSRCFEEALRNNLIPYKSVGSIAFYDRAEIKDILAYLSLIRNERDDIAFERIVNTPKRAIGTKTLEKLSEFAQFKGWSLYKSVRHIEEIPTMTPTIRKKLVKFLDLIESIKEAVKDKPLKTQLEEIYELSGYREYLETDKNVNSEAKQANLEELFESAKNFADPDELLANAALSSSFDELDDSKKVTLMTVHSAKGLEFPVVFLTGLEDGVFPSYFAIEKNDVEEERRLCYVGITRAQQRLYMTYAQKRYIGGSVKTQKPSRFLLELPQAYIPNVYLDREPSRTKVDELYRTSIHEPNVDTEFKESDMVRHKVFGTGKIIENRKGILTIVFPEIGIKKIDEHYVEKI